ncbi:MAG: MFS transporter [Candidatus Altiarchaeota archaeon]
MASSFKRIYGLQVIFGLMLVFGWSFAILHYLNLGFSYLELLFYNVVSFTSAVVIIILLGEIQAYRSIKFAVFLFIIIFVLLMNLTSSSQLFMISILSGATIPFFWIPFNIILFRLRSEDNVAQFSSIAFFVFPTLSTVIPYISGVVIEEYGYPTVFGVSIIMLCAMLAYIKKIEEPLTINVSFAQAVHAAKNLRSIMLVEGFWQGVNWIVFPLYTYYFIKESASYGAFLSYVGFAGACASLLLAKISDRFKKRHVFVCTTVILTAALTIISGIVSGQYPWVLSRTLVGFAVSLYAPFTLTVVLDVMDSTRMAMVAREVFLNIGRIIGGVFVLLAYLAFGSLQSTLIVSGIIFLLYPVIVSKKGLCTS